MTVFNMGSFAHTWWSGVIIFRDDADIGNLFVIILLQSPGFHYFWVKIDIQRMHNCTSIDKIHDWYAEQYVGWWEEDFDVDFGGY